MATALKPTPKTIEEAIKNGLEDVKPGTDPVDTVKLHVKDYLAQKWGILEPETIRLWNTVFPEDPR